MDRVVLDWDKDIASLRPADLRRLADAVEALPKGSSGTLTWGDDDAPVYVYVDHTVAVILPFARPSSQ